MATTASTTAGHGGMVQPSLNDGCVWMDERRAVALFGAVAASMAGLSRSMRQYLFCRWIGERWWRRPLQLVHAVPAESALDWCVPQTQQEAWLGPSALVPFNLMVIFTNCKMKKARSMKKNIMSPFTCFIGNNRHYLSAVGGRMFLQYSHG